jgi:hypothetical protein
MAGFQSDALVFLGAAGGPDCPKLTPNDRGFHED